MKRIRAFVCSMLCLFFLPAAIRANSGQGLPVILHLSDAVQPGKLFTINGEWITDDPSLEVALDNSTTILGTVPSKKAILLPIVQRDRDGRFVVLMLPENILPGVYAIWIKNRIGWGKPVVLNAARVLFLSEHEAYRGLTVKLSGRNLDGKEFGVNHGQTKVRLADGAGKIFETKVCEVNPYCVSFVIGNQPVGNYFIEASNNGGVNWGRLKNGQRLRILPVPKGGQKEVDPLGMGVAWASHFNWKNRFNVPASNGKDITGVVQGLIDKAGKAPDGGVVYFPAGKYVVAKLLLREKVVLLGESRENTFLLYDGHEKDFITCAGSAIVNGHVGIARLHITVPPAIKARPDVFINLGQAAIWQAVSNIHQRTASEMFVVDTKIDYDFTETKPDRRGLPVSSIGKERLYVANCEFVGFHMESHNYVSEYVTVKNNYAEFGQGVFIYTGDFLFLENNRIKGHTEINREKHGFMIRANSYLFNNTVAHTGSDEGPGNDNFNDGEAICNETPGAAHNYGFIKTATVNSITAGYTYGPFAIPKVEIYNHRSLLIVHGRGLGQYRRVKSIDTMSRKITLESDWDVVPDTTSRFTLIEPNENIVYYKNTIIDNPKGYWLFGNSIDCVVADNVSIDCDGVFLFSCIYTNDENPQYYFTPNYFNRIIGNRISGVSRKSRRSGIGINSTREGRTNGHYVGVVNYANEIRENYITGIPGETPLAGVTEAPAVSGIFVYATVHSSAYDGKGISGDATNQLIEGNVLRNLNAGINLSRCIYGQVIRDNLSDGTVTVLVNDTTGSEHTLRMPVVADTGLHFGNGQCGVYFSKGDTSLWQYHADAFMKPIQMSAPVFEIDGKQIKASWKDPVLEKTDTLKNGVIRYRVAGTLVKDDDLCLTVFFQLAPGNPIVKFRYSLSAKRTRHFTKNDGKDRLQYFSVSLSKASGLQEVRLSDYNEKNHAYGLTELSINASAFEDSAALMGPLMVSTSAGYAAVFAYEHGSQYPNRFLEYRLLPDNSMGLYAVKSNYLKGQVLDEQHPFETVWLHVGAVKGDVTNLASAYRHFILHFISEYPASRSPYIFYNTWGRQERVKWAGGTYLSSMNLAYTLKEIEVAHKMGIEVYVLDMGWYQKTGDWNVNKKLFPDSLRQVKVLLDKYGMKLGLWFNPTVASVSSEMLAKNDANRMVWNGQRDKPFPIWETEESVRLSLVSPFWQQYADKMIQLVKELGVTYFKLDAVFQYAANGTGHFYGAEENAIEERTESYAFQLPAYMAKIVERVQSVCPEAIFDFDVTEPGRAVGLQFLSVGKFFMINNGPYFHSFDLAKEWGSPLPSGNAQLFTNPGPARGWFTRPIMRYDKWIPSILFLAHYQPAGDSASLDINLASAVLGANGIWGELLKCTPYQIEHTRTVLDKYKMVRNDMQESDPFFSGEPGTSPEIYEKINKQNGRGAIVIFAQEAGTYHYISHNMAAEGIWNTGTVKIRRDAVNRAVIDCVFTKPGANIIFFGVN